MGENYKVGIVLIFSINSVEDVLKAFTITSHNLKTLNIKYLTE
jgi:hypothetical protein